MPKFIFQAKSVDGKFIKGEVNASTEPEAYVKIRAQKMIPIKVVPQGTVEVRSEGINLFSDKVKLKDLQVFTRQFSVLIKAGVPVVQSFESLIRGTGNLALKRALKKVMSNVEKGQLLAQAMSSHPHIFNKMYVSLVTAGEEGGVLDTVLDQMAHYLEKLAKMRSKILGALWYPAAIVVVAFAVVTGILVFVIPQFVDMFEGMGQELPIITQWVIKASEFFQKYWYVALGILVGAPIGLQMYYKTSEGRKIIDSALLDAPLFGDLILKGAIARFTRTLSTLLYAGVRIMEALEISANTSGNWVIERLILRARDSVSKGKTLAEPLTQEKHIPTMVTQMISVGEQTGNLDNMLNKVADFYEDEVEQAAETLISMIEPILMVVLGGIIAFIVIAMYLPIFNMADVIK